MPAEYTAVIVQYYIFSVNGSLESVLRCEYTIHSVYASYGGDHFLIGTIIYVHYLHLRKANELAQLDKDINERDPRRVCSRVTAL